jgi:fructose-1,6-bisphosphatase/inositol monophosphatase family enzyme
MIMMTSNLLGADGNCPQWASAWLSQTKLKTRILGTAALEGVQVAAGVAHGAVTVNGKLWDLAAAAAIVLESGGKITDLQGRDIFPFQLDQYSGAKVPFLAATPRAQAELLAHITRIR